MNKRDDDLKQAFRDVLFLVAPDLPPERIEQAVTVLVLVVDANRMRLAASPPVEMVERKRRMPRRPGLNVVKFNGVKVNGGSGAA